ncbi:MAG: MarR family transcriptional regulator [Candidatus Aenigmatarchaeota archaeon]
MKNRIVGILIIGIAALIGYIILIFNTAMADIVNTACGHGPTCPMWGTLNFQTNVSMGIMVFIVIIGLYLIFFGKEERIVTKIKTVQKQLDPKNVTKANYQKIMRGLGEDERNVLERLIEAQGTILQSDLVNQTGFTKVKVTRILDRLEGKNLIERRRRGMTNSIIIKHH